MKNVLKLLLGNNKKDNKALKDRIIKAKDEDIKEIRRLNKRFRVLLDTGSIEITIKNVDGVIKELKK